MAKKKALIQNKTNLCFGSMKKHGSLSFLIMKKVLD